MRVLIVEDEPKMAALIARGLREDGHAADTAERGEAALWMAQAVPYDAIVLDVMLPGLDGFATCRRLREQGVWAPVLMLTARDAVRDRVDGLDAGADDYLLKPFSFAELLARLRALVRRARSPRMPTGGKRRTEIAPTPRRSLRSCARTARLRSPRPAGCRRSCPTPRSVPSRPGRGTGTAARSGASTASGERSRFTRTSAGTQESR